MESTPLVVNEWLIHDLRGDNGEERQREGLQFLVVLVKKCDHLVVLEGSQWMAKAYNLMTHSELKIRQASIYLRSKVLLDPLKITKRNPKDISVLPEKLKALVSAEDEYLIQLHLAVPGSIVVTTDEDLQHSFSPFPEVRIRLRTRFMAEYLTMSNA